jgi:hypothetical protein
MTDHRLPMQTSAESEKLENAVSKSGNPNAVDGDCESDHCHGPSRPNSLTGFCNHVSSLPFSHCRI